MLAGGFLFPLVNLLEVIDGEDHADRCSPVWAAAVEDRDSIPVVDDGELRLPVNEELQHERPLLFCRDAVGAVFVADGNTVGKAHTNHVRIQVDEQRPLTLEDIGQRRDCRVAVDTADDEQQIPKPHESLLGGGMD